MILIVNMTLKKHIYFNKLIKAIDTLTKDYQVIAKIENICNVSYDKVTGVIISGSSLSTIHITDNKFKKLELALIPLILCRCPILGICFGYQLLNKIFGGTNKKLANMVHCDKKITLENHPLFAGLPNYHMVKLYHHDAISQCSKFFTAIAHNNDKKILAFANEKYQIYGTQFHPEGLVSTHIILHNFLLLCKH